MNRNLAIGTKVVVKETGWNDYSKATFVFSRFGEIIERNDDGSRYRIKWSHTVLVSGENTTRKVDTKRTWIKSDRVLVVPTDVSISIDVLDENLDPII